MATTTLSLRSHEVAFLQAALQIGFRDIGQEQIGKLSVPAQAVARELQGAVPASTDPEVSDWAREIRMTALPALTHNN